MRFTVLLSLALFGGLLSAQTCIYTWGNDPANPLSPNQPVDIFPQGPNVGAPFDRPLIRHHFRIPAVVFQNVPTVITDLAVGVRSGMRVMNAREFTLRMGHSTAAPGSTSFAFNITSPLTDVIVLRDHVWQLGFGPAWIPFGLQHPFQFVPGQGDLLIELITRDLALLSSFTFGGLVHSHVGEWLVGGGTTTLPTTGVNGSMPAFRLCTDHGEIGLYGQSCQGSPGSAPLLGVSGVPSLGGSTTFWLSDARANGLAALAYGFDTSPPYPNDLTSLGATGCRQYFAIAADEFVLTNGVGIGQHNLLLPNASTLVGLVLYTQYFAVDPPGNALGITSSNYARMLIGL